MDSSVSDVLQTAGDSERASVSPSDAEGAVSTALELGYRHIDTADAIVTGCLHAQVGAIERMFRLVAAEEGALCLLNGGAAGSLAPHLECPLRLVENLVLEGLAHMRQEL